MDYTKPSNMQAGWTDAEINGAVAAYNSGGRVFVPKTLTDNWRGGFVPMRPLSDITQIVRAAAGGKPSLTPAQFVSYIKANSGKQLFGEFLVLASSVIGGAMFIQGQWATTAAKTAAQTAVQVAKSVPTVPKATPAPVAPPVPPAGTSAMLDSVVSSPVVGKVADVALGIGATVATAKLTAGMPPKKPAILPPPQSQTPDQTTPASVSPVAILAAVGAVALALFN